MTGVLHGVGVGPGDPELLTAKAIRVIGEADCVFYLEADGRPSRALSIAQEHIPAKAVRNPIAMPMRVDPAAGSAVYDATTAQIRRAVGKGEIVVVLCEGDPLLYGSFIYLMERLEGDFPIEITPGIPSFLAAGSAVRRGLVKRSGSLSLIAATADEADLAEHLKNTDCAAILKTGRHLPKVRRVLRKCGFGDAQVIEEAAGPGEKITPLDMIDGDTLPYFSIILAWNEEQA